MRKLAVSAITLCVASLSWQAQASTVQLGVSGPGVSGVIQLTYGTATDAKYPQAFEVTGISGYFSDSNNGMNIVDAPVGPLEPIKHDAPEPTNLLAPNDFSRFAVATGLPEPGFSYDNLYWPSGSLQTATDYSGHGGSLDIYGLLFDIGNGVVVNLWSNGVGGTGMPDYGVGVATSAKALDYVAGGVSVSPEPGALGLLGIGLAGLLACGRRLSSRSR